MDITFIGLGGIGSIVTEKICRFLNFSKDLHPINVTLVDGDVFEPKNSERQEFGELGGKADIKCKDLMKKFPQLNISAINEYVSEMNVEDIVSENSFIVLGVDNHKTRKLISDYADTLNDCVIFSGGNDYINGNVQIYIRKGGEKISPSLTDYHPEIDNPDDKSPEEMSCEELHNVEPQLYFVNLGAATLICWTFYMFLQNKLENVSEVYFDMAELKVQPAIRMVP